MTIPDHLRTGATGEELAAQWLEARGFTILHRNWRHGRDEIDLVAREGRFLVAVEVKTRHGAAGTLPEHAVDAAKRRRLMRAAEELAHRSDPGLELRFDVLSIVLSPQGPEFFHIPNAFYPTLNEQAT